MRSIPIALPDGRLKTTALVCPWGAAVQLMSPGGSIATLGCARCGPHYKHGGVLQSLATKPAGYCRFRCRNLLQRAANHMEFHEISGTAHAYRRARDNRDHV